MTRPGFKPAACLQILPSRYREQVQTICHKSFPAECASQLISQLIVLFTGTTREKKNISHYARLQTSSLLAIFFSLQITETRHGPSPRVFFRPSFHAEYLGLNHPLEAIKIVNPGQYDSSTTRTLFKPDFRLGLFGPWTDSGCVPARFLSPKRSSSYGPVANLPQKA
jgi:hypothetical protein